MRAPHLILGIGELLWDMPPNATSGAAGHAHTHEPRGTLGGAPANFTVMAGRLGNHAAILSRIGRDELGREAVENLNPMPVDTGALQIDAAHSTGSVTVDLSHGEPRYTIHGPVAWDYMELSDEWVRLAERADAICFGTLAQRSEQSRQTIQALAAQTASACIRVFDVNLRPPFYSEEIVEESLELATVAKMNEAEAPLILDLLGLDAAEPGLERTVTLRFAAERLLEEFPGLATGGDNARQPRQPAGDPRRVERASGVPRRSWRLDWRGRRFYCRDNPLPAARLRPGHAQRSRQSLGRMGGVAIGRNA